MQTSPHTPPTSPAPFDPNHPDLFVDRPKWPSVIGIISISWASLGLLCGVLSVFFFAWMNSGSFREMTEKGMGSPMPDLLRPNTLQFSLMSVGTVWAGVLLFAGIATLTRKETGRMLHLLYATVAIVLAVVGLVLQAKQMSAVRAWADANPDNKWAQQQKPMGQFLGICFAMFFSLAYPVFLALWFGMGKGREKIR